MLITLARLIWRFLRLLVIEAPPDVQMDVNEKCPGCGHFLGGLVCVHVNGQVLIEHTCQICSARWYVIPVMNAAADLVLPQKTVTK